MWEVHIKGFGWSARIDGKAEKKCYLDVRLTCIEQVVSALCLRSAAAVQSSFIQVPAEASTGQQGDGLVNLEGKDCPKTDESVLFRRITSCPMLVSSRRFCVFCERGRLVCSGLFERLDRCVSWSCLVLRTRRVRFAFREQMVLQLHRVKETEVDDGPIAATNLIIR